MCGVFSETFREKPTHQSQMPSVTRKQTFLVLFLFLRVKRCLTSKAAKETIPCKIRGGGGGMRNEFNVSQGLCKRLTFH